MTFQDPIYNVQIFFQFIVAICHIPFGDAAPAIPVADVVNGADSMINLIEKFRNLVGDVSGIRRMKRLIEQINTEVEELKREERELIADALKKYRKTDNQMKVMRLALRALATETKRRTETVLRIIAKIDGSDVEADLKKNKLAIKLFAKLMDRSKVLLAEAKVEYRKAIASLIDVDEDLKKFKKSVNGLRDSSSDRYSTATTAIRATAYSLAGYSSCTTPLALFTCPIAFATAAAVVEPIIAKWKSDVRGMLSKLDESVAETDRHLTKIKRSVAQLEREQRVVVEWDSNVYESDDVIDELGLFIEADLKSEVTVPLQSLVNTCKQFLKISA